MSARLTKNSDEYKAYLALGKCPPSQPTIAPGSEYRPHLGELYCCVKEGRLPCNIKFQSTGALTTHLKKTHNCTVPNIDEKARGNPSHNVFVEAKEWYCDIMENAPIPPTMIGTGSNTLQIVVPGMNAPAQPIPETPKKPAKQRGEKPDGKKKTSSNAVSSTVQTRSNQKETKKRIAWPVYKTGDSKGKVNFTRIRGHLKKVNAQQPCKVCLARDVDATDCFIRGECESLAYFYMDDTEGRWDVDFPFEEAYDDI